MIRAAPPPVLVLAALLAPASASAACGAAPIASLPLRAEARQIMLPVSIDGSAETMVLDTGAGVTVLSKAVADRLNIPHDFDRAAQVEGVGGANSVLFIGQPHSFALGAIHLRAPNFPIVDMGAASGGTQTAGLLGGDILRHFNVDLNFAAGRMDLWAATGPDCTDDTPPWHDDAAAIPIDIDESNRIRVPFKLDGITLAGLIDTGAASFVLTTRAAYRAGVTEDALESDPRIHGTGVNSRPWAGYLHVFGAMQFGAVTYPHLAAALVPNSGAFRNDAVGDADALIGLPLLMRQRLWISYRAHEIRALPAGGG